MSTPGQTREAWLLAGPALGTDVDLARMRGLLTEELHPEHRFTVRAEKHATQRAIEEALDDIGRSRGWCLLWLGGHAFRERDKSEVTFFRTADTSRIEDEEWQAGYLTLNRVWRRLEDIARESKHPIIAIVDTCHSEPPPYACGRGQAESRSQLIAIAAARGSQAARGDAEGGWLTRHLADLWGKGPGAADQVNDRLAPISPWILERLCATSGQGDRQAVVRTDEDLRFCVLNRVSVEGRDDEVAVDAFFQALQRGHESLIRFLDWHSSVPLTSIYVELDLVARRAGEAPRETPRTLAGLMRRGGCWNVEGMAGAGKTTLARHLVWSTAAERSGPVALFLSLSSWAEGDASALEAALDGLPAAGLAQAEAAHDRGELWLLLDGLDEVAKDDRERIHRRIAALPDELPRAGVAVLTRPTAGIEGWPTARVQELTDPQQRALLTNRLGPDRAGDVLAHSARHDLVAMGNPFMLTLLALIAERDGSLPPDRATLYDQAVEVLLRQGHKRGSGVRRPELARKVIAHLSLALHRADGEHWPEAQIIAALEDTLDGDELAQRVEDVWGDAATFVAELADRSGVLGPHDGRGADWRYLHRSLREVLAAEALLADCEAAQEIRAALSEDADRWGNVVRLMCGRSPEPLRELAAVREVNAEYALDALAAVAGRVEPDEALRFLCGTKGWTGDHLLALARRWAPAEARALVAGLAVPDPPEWVLPPEPAHGWVTYDDAQRRRILRGYAWYVLEALGVGREDFFEEAHLARAPNLEWVPIDRFEYLMGDEEQHEEVVGPLKVAPHPVTVGAFAAFTGEPVSGKGDHPVADVTWWEANLFAGWAGASLPTEAEWEGLCRGGTTTRWSHGDDEARLGEYAWYDENSGLETHPVGEKKANPFGLYDMHGNVWEWCATPVGSHRVVRGGSYWLGADWCRSAFRNWRRPGARDDDLGFRLVRRPPASSGSEGDL